MSLASLEFLLSQMFYIPDLVPFRVVLAVALESLGKRASDPVWVALVNAPSSLKTELIESLSEVRTAYAVGKITRQTIVSGWQAKPGNNKTNLGLLGTLKRENKNLILMKEFGTILSFDKNDRQVILGQLREIFDGHYVAEWGTGARYEWRGQVYLLAATTEAIFDHQHSIAALGERFLYLCLPPLDRALVSAKALDTQEKMEAGVLSRQHLAREVAQFLHGLDPDVPVQLSESDRNRLAALADVATRLRTPVSRDRYSKEVLRWVTPEGTARLIKSLASIWRSLARLRGETSVSQDDFPTCIRLALDSVHPSRRRILRIAYASLLPLEYRAFAAGTTPKEATAKRICEDLYVVGIMAGTGTGQSATCGLTDQSRKQLDVILSGVSDPAELLEGFTTRKKQ